MWKTPTSSITSTIGQPSPMNPPHIVNMSAIPINSLMTSCNLAHPELQLVNKENDHLTLALEQEKN